MRRMHLYMQTGMDCLFFFRGQMPTVSACNGQIVVSSPRACSASASQDELPDGWLRYQYVRSGYRVNYSYRMAIASILSTRHNEFWIMWSDILPILVFSTMYHWGTRQEENHKEMARTIMFAAAISCRMCSLAYHTFHCVSPRLNRDLIYLDLIGICTNALGVPWTVVGIARWDVASSTWVRGYLAGFMACYACCIAIFAYSLFSGKRLYYINATREQAMIVALAVAGCMPSLSAGSWSGPVCFAAGYAFFYVGKLPESYIYNKFKAAGGAAAGEVWNSHVLWHAATWAGQMCFICTSMGSERTGA